MTFFKYTVLYPIRLNLADFCTKKWRLSSSKILDRTPAMPASPPEKRAFRFLHRWSIDHRYRLRRYYIQSSSTFTIFSSTSYRPIQNVPAISLFDFPIYTNGFNWFNTVKPVGASLILFSIVYMWCLPVNAQDKTGIWMKYEMEFTSAVTYDNPLYDVKEFTITFTAPSGKQTNINGFWDGGTNWKVRFMPDETGSWTFSSRCSDKSNAGLHEVTGNFECVPHQNEHAIYTHGSIHQPDGTYHMTYSDGTPFFWTGGTAWNGALKSTPEEWDKYLQNRVEKNFSVIQFVTTQWRGCESDRNGQVAFTGWTKRWTA